MLEKMMEWDATLEDLLEEAEAAEEDKWYPIYYESIFHVEYTDGEIILK